MPHRFHQEQKTASGFSRWALIAATVGLLSGCTMPGAPTPAATSYDSTPATPNTTTTTNKTGTTTKLGKITTIGGKFYLTESGKEPKEIESYQVELSQYVGQTVTVSGQYSGDTLFVGEVK